MTTYTLQVTRCEGSTARVAHELAVTHAACVWIGGAEYRLQPGSSITAMLVPGMAPTRTVVALRRGPGRRGTWVQCSADGVSHAVEVAAEYRGALRQVYGPALSARTLARAPEFAAATARFSHSRPCLQ